MEQLELFNGRPVDVSTRLPKEIRSYDLLDHLNIDYVRVDHKPHASIEGCEAVDTILQIAMCKNLFLCNRQESNFYLLMMPGHKKFVTKELSAQLGVARLSFAKETYMEDFLDITPGSVSIMGLMNDTENHVQLLVDEEVLKKAYFGCHPCRNTSSLRIKTEDIVKVFLPEVHHEMIVVQLPSYGY